MNTQLLILVFLSSYTSHARREAKILQPVSRMISRKGSARVHRFGGEGAERNAIKYVAHIVWINGFTCHGALVTSRWVVSAAYCSSFSFNITKKPEVTLGAHDVTVTEHTQQIFKAYKFVFHPEYVWSEDFDHRYDLALIRLDRAAKLNEYVHPVPMAPLRAHDYAGSLLLLSSYGVGGRNEPLNSAKVRAIGNDECTEETKKEMHEGIICINTQGGTVGLCEGDTGAPLVDIETNHLVGVGSFIHGDHCYTGGPHGFQRISVNIPWLWKAIDQEN